MHMTTANPLGLLHLLRLASPALPVGAFAYSQSLESAVDMGWVEDEAGAFGWISGVLETGLANTDLPALARLYDAWAADDELAVVQWNRWLIASRETAELRAEDRMLGRALVRLLSDLGHTRATDLVLDKTAFATAFALAAVDGGVGRDAALQGYAWTWLENQAIAASKLVPLGQTATQRLLTATIPRVVTAVDWALALADDDMGASLPGVAMASSWHETQYSRLFRS